MLRIMVVARQDGAVPAAKQQEILNTNKTLDQTTEGFVVVK